MHSYVRTNICKINEHMALLEDHELTLGLAVPVIAFIRLLKSAAPIVPIFLLLRQISPQSVTGDAHISYYLSCLRTCTQTGRCAVLIICLATSTAVISILHDFTNRMI